MTINILVYRINDLIFFCVFRLKFSLTAIMTLVNVLMQVLDRAYSRTVFNIQYSTCDNRTLCTEHDCMEPASGCPAHEPPHAQTLQPPTITWIAIFIIDGHIAEVFWIMVFAFSLHQAGTVHVALSAWPMHH